MPIVQHVPVAEEFERFSAKVENADLLVRRQHAGGDLESIRAAAKTLFESIHYWMSDEDFDEYVTAVSLDKPYALGIT